MEATQPSIRVATEDDFKQIQNLYQDSGYHGGVNANDQIFVAISQEKIIGVVKICLENGHYILRGMYLKANFQRKRIGTALLQKANEWLQERKCFCIPFSNLRPFYGQIGFEEIKDETAPDFLLERARSYRNDNHDVVIMFRKGG